MAAVKPGQERFRAITSTYYRGAHGFMLMYDAGDMDSVDAIKQLWLEEIRKCVGSTVHVLIVVISVTAILMCARAGCEDAAVMGRPTRRS